MNDFSYLGEKIKESPFILHPFPHIEITHFLRKDHLDIILKEKQIHFEEQKSHEQLYSTLLEKKWKILHFPGCTTDWNTYKKYWNQKKVDEKNPIENIGITFRLDKVQNPIIQDLIQYMNSPLFHDILRDKFSLKKATSIISAIQKNLSGYEISPHPDKRGKALTYLLNINHEIDKSCHTHLLQFLPKYKSIEKYWNENQNVERCWVPWEWCKTAKLTNKNNSIIIFAPTSEPASLHAVKLKYDHLPNQRTQIYGNLMFSETKHCQDANYKQLEKVYKST